LSRGTSAESVLVGLDLRRLLLCHRMYVSWAWEAEVKAWNAKQIAASKIKKVNHGETEFSRKM
jgi:hypothetical protein